MTDRSAASPQAPDAAPQHRQLGGTVVALGLVSLLTDTSSEMIYPLLPLLLTGALGASLAHVGLIEGAAEGAAALLKLVSGHLSDRLPRRKPLVLLGYGLSALVRPCLALAQGPLGVLALRLGDRLGKGLRSGPRDALLADATPPELRGRAFGLHRALDNAGAMVGPLMATVLLGAGLGLRSVIGAAAVPGALALLVLLLAVRETPRPATHRTRSRLPPAGQAPGPPVLPPPLRRYLAALAVFSLGNCSDALLLLWAHDMGVPGESVPLLWMAHNGTRAALTTPLGALSDRLGRRKLILCAWAVHAAVYAGCTMLRGPGAAWVLLCVYGLHHALREGADKALVADLAPPALRGRAFGWFHGVLGAAALPGSLLFALLYQGPGRAAAFGLGAALAGLAALLLLRVPEPRRPPP